ncbi:cytochrome P450 4d8-like [Haematobia irritans]|uniref:cytochrome P450 4d8-like n=1 Tax=Haematobia irritans TaxID=7368 RepID=UPI003F509F97
MPDQYSVNDCSMSTTVIILISFALFVVMAYIIHESKRHMRKAVEKINGPYCLPLIGPIHLAYQVDPQNIFGKGLDIGIKYGNFVKFWIMNRLIITCSDPEINEQLLSNTTHTSKHRLYGVLHQWLGTGLLTSDDRKWHARRKIITPTFHYKILEEFVEIFHQQAEVFVQHLRSQADGKSAFDIYPYICSATLDIIAETAMGTKIGAQTHCTAQYTSAVEETTRITAWRFLRIHVHNDLLFSILHPFKRMRQQKNIRIMHEFTHSVIKERRKVLEQEMMTIIEGMDTDDNHKDQIDIGSKRRMALLDVLLQSTINGKPLSDEDIREEVDTFMFEGHDTTANALGFTMYLLSRHPEVQNKLLNEIHQTYGEDASISCSMTSLRKMKYMECVIKESLRLYPSVPLIAREITKDFKYKHSKLGEGVIPAGTEFIIAIYYMSANGVAFENPSEFRPERHLDVNMCNSFNYLPFSAGPRNCIGQKFAMLEMKVVLTHVIRSYELLPIGESVKPVLGIVLRSKNGMQMGLRKREWFNA